MLKMYARLNNLAAAITLRPSTHVRYIYCFTFLNIYCISSCQLFTLNYAQPLLVPTMEGSGTGGSVSPTLAAPAEPPTLLSPGEVIKPSGKFPKPTKIPGKNYSKDEVVIRNADSGKGERCLV